MISSEMAKLEVRKVEWLPEVCQAAFIQHRITVVIVVDI